MTSTCASGETSRQVFVPAKWTAKLYGPVVLFLHGRGKRDSDNQTQLSQGLPLWLRQHGQDLPALVVIPQAPDGTAWNGETEQMPPASLDDSISRWHRDRRGNHLRRHSPPQRRSLAVCGGDPAGTGDPCAGVASHIGRPPSWIFNGAIDDVVLPEEAQRIYTSLAGHRRRCALHTRFPGAWPAAHAVRDRWPWMFAHRPAFR
ncbi:MAG: esterase [Rhodanobacter sp.]